MGKVWEKVWEHVLMGIKSASHLPQSPSCFPVEIGGIMTLVKTNATKYS